MLRYQSSIPTIERFSHHFLSNTTSCFIDRTIPYLIVRLKGLWLILLTTISCLAMIIIFQRPKLQLNICDLTFETIPSHLSAKIDEKSVQNLNIDITYYIGSNWDVPSESLIPLRDYPKLDYLFEDQMSSNIDETHRFAYALKTNLSQLIEFCSLIKSKIPQRSFVYKHYQRHISDT